MKHKDYSGSLVLIVIVGACFVMGMFFYVTTIISPDLSLLGKKNQTTYSVVLDDEGEEFLRFELDKRQDVQYEDISPLVINAFVAAEDHRFFEHHGVSFK